MTRNNKIVIVDTVYPNFLQTARSVFDQFDGYKESLDKFMGLGFGTADFYSKNLSTYGFETYDIIANYTELQRKWCHENSIEYKNSIHCLLNQIRRINPGIVFFQDLSFPAELFEDIKKMGIVLAGQCSCPMPPKQNIEKFSVLFTSFPHYVDIFKSLGVKAVYNKLAFEHTILDRLKNGPKQHVISFVGGVGVPSHWSYGMRILEAIASDFTNKLEVWGYGYNLLPKTSNLYKCYRGEAYGLKMCQIYKDSLMVINRHGEVAKNFANNMRMFESTGCGTCLVTDMKDNLGSFFDIGTEVVAYSDIKDILEKIDDLVVNPDKTLEIGKAGQKRTLSEHTYLQTMKNVADHLRAYV